jgi:hypothetical protein
MMLAKVSKPFEVRVVLDEAKLKWKESWGILFFYWFLEEMLVNLM